MSIEENIRKAFEGVRKDILGIKDQLLSIVERQEKLEATMQESKKKVNGNSHTDDLVQIRSGPKKSVKKATKKKVVKNAAKKK